MKIFRNSRNEPQTCIIYADVECSLRSCNADDSSSVSESEEGGEGLENLECEGVQDYNEQYDLEEYCRKKKTNFEGAVSQEHVLQLWDTITCIATIRAGVITRVIEVAVA
ncbi:hypothetical protein QAD02_007262 [Eretmocerus hayati]|uniref:Uncharacterized protein n=1 Tax=Eretmocerus hayati TaxID=131215 RepID=A0ACC2N354_9HYME|nr:hypothetical protein QAD02_007262 [Eretmocerus hayati]